MRNKILFACLFGALSLFGSCDKDDHMHTDEFEYHAHMHSPNADARHVGDTLHIQVDFESHTGMIVHHVKVRLYNTATNIVVYNEPSDAHVYETDGLYAFADDFILSEANGITSNTDWTLEASVWGHSAGIGEVKETVEFHVDP